MKKKVYIVVIYSTRLPSVQFIDVSMHPFYAKIQ